MQPVLSTTQLEQALIAPCRRCRLLHVRCDRQLPCGSCTTAGVGTSCHFDRVGTHRGRPKRQERRAPPSLPPLLPKPEFPPPYAPQPLHSEVEVGGATSTSTSTDAATTPSSSVTCADVYHAPERKTSHDAPPSVHPLPSLPSFGGVFDLYRSHVLNVRSGALSASAEEVWFFELLRPIPMDTNGKEMSPLHAFPSAEFDRCQLGERRPLVAAISTPMCRLLGYEEEAIHGANSARLYSPTVYRAIVEEYLHNFAKNEPYASSPIILSTCPLLSNKGRVIHTLASSQVSYDSQGQIVYSLSVLHGWFDAGQVIDYQRGSEVDEIRQSERSQPSDGFLSYNNGC